MACSNEINSTKQKMTHHFNDKVIQNLGRQGPVSLIFTALQYLLDCMTDVPRAQQDVECQRTEHKMPRLADHISVMQLNIPNVTFATKESCRESTFIGKKPTMN